MTVLERQRPSVPDLYAPVAGELDPLLVRGGVGYEGRDLGALLPVELSKLFWGE